jgi:hypothetical protein
MPTSRKLTLQDLTAARQLYEQGQSYRDLGARFGCSHSTIRALLTAVGCASRPVGWPQRPPQPAPPQPRPRPAVEIAPDFTGRLRIPCRTREERRLRAWTAAERQAIAVELAADRVTVARRGQSGLPERRSIYYHDAARFAFWMALQKVKRAA